MQYGWIQRIPFAALAAVRARVARSRFAAIGALLAASCATSAHAQGDSASAAPACLKSSSIHHTEVLDDRTILFVMRDHSTYRNTLANTCLGLSAERRFMYGQSSFNICKGSVINVVVYAFGDLTRGASCWLGSFEPLSSDEVEELLALSTAARKDQSASRRHAIKAEPVELPPTTLPPTPPQTEKTPSPGNAANGN